MLNWIITIIRLKQNRSYEKGKQFSFLNSKIYVMNCKFCNRNQLFAFKIISKKFIFIQLKKKAKRLFPLIRLFEHVTQVYYALLNIWVIFEVMLPFAFSLFYKKKKKN